MSDYTHMTKEGQRITGHRFYDQLVSTLDLNNHKVLNNEKIVINEQENNIIFNSETSFETNVICESNLQINGLINCEQIDNVQLDIARLENQIDNIDVNKQTLIKVNNDDQDVPYSFFNDDVIAYYDFSSAKYVGKDLSGRNNHMDNSGVTQALDIDGRKYSAFYDRNNHTIYNDTPYNNQRVLKLTNTESFSLTEFSVSTWFKTSGTDPNQSIFCFHDSDDNVYTTGTYPLEGTYFDIRGNVNSARILFCLNGTVVLNCNKTGLASNTWHHVAVTMSPTGNAFYVNGALYTGYTVGNAGYYVNLQAIRIDNISIGGVRENKATFDYDKGDLYRFAYRGYVSDAIIYNRAISAAEITQLYNNHIGYAVVVLAGQSNCVGRDTIEVGVDDDYRLLENRVDMFHTKTNINQSTYGIVDGVISTAVNPMSHPDANATNNGFWRTFATDLIQYAYMPYRMKVLIVPCAQGGTSLLNNWSIGENSYEICKSAMGAVSDGGVYVTNKMNKMLAFLWHQGESDIMTKNLNYESDFHNMLNNFELELQLDTFDLDKIAVIVAQISAEYNIVDTSTTPDTFMVKYINDSLQRIADSKPNYGVVQGDDLNNLGDFIHLTRKSQRILGSRYYDQLVSILGFYSKKAINNEKLIIDENDNKVIVNGVFESNGLVINPVYRVDKTNLTLDTYFSCSKTYTCTGAYTGALAFNYTKLGNIVMVTLTTTVDITMVADNLINITGQSDPLLLPSNNQTCLSSYKINTPEDYKVCMYNFLANGNIQISSGLTVTNGSLGYFTSGKTINLRRFTACYVTA